MSVSRGLLHSFFMATLYSIGKMYYEVPSCWTSGLFPNFCFKTMPQ